MCKPSRRNFVEITLADEGVVHSPFRAGFGKSPPVLVGRERLVREFSQAIATGEWSQSRVSLIRGIRGVGKTVALNCLERIAAQRGWKVVSLTATPGFFKRIVDQELPRILDVIDPKRTTRVSKIGIAGVFDISTESLNKAPIGEDFRSQMRRINDQLAPAGQGILFTLDEVHTSAIADMRQFASELQHAIRTDWEVAFVGAGLHASIADLLREESLTFLRRAASVHLDLLQFDEVEDALAGPIRLAGRDIEVSALDYAARATQGYPFLVQLIGDLAWKANPAEKVISEADVRLAFATARLSMGANIFQPAIADLSPAEVEVLTAMSVDDGPSRAVDLRSRLGKDSNWLNQYRRRLENSGAIFSVGRGLTDISMPFLREYLRENITDRAASDIAAARAFFPPPPPL